MSNITFKLNRSYTPIDNVFIDEYMSKPDSALFSLIYIYACRCAYAGFDASNESIAKALGILESDVVKAWRYWHKQGVIEIHKNKNTVNIEFLPLVSHTEETENKTETLPETESVDKKVLEKTQFTPADISSIAKRDKDLAQLLELAQYKLGKTLSHLDTQKLVAIHDQLSLGNDVIALLLTFAGDKGKKMRYIETVAQNWHDMGINSVEAAEEYLASIDKSNMIMRYLALKREPSVDERKYIYKWLSLYKMPTDLIRFACEKTLKSAGASSFPYCDSIIENWHNQNINTLEAARDADIEYARANKGVSKEKVAQVKKPSGFNNYTQRDYDETELENILKSKHD